MDGELLYVNRSQYTLCLIAQYAHRTKSCIHETVIVISVGVWLNCCHMHTYTMLVYDCIKPLVYASNLTNRSTIALWLPNVLWWLVTSSSFQRSFPGFVCVKTPYRHQLINGSSWICIVKILATVRHIIVALTDSGVHILSCIRAWVVDPAAVD